MSTTQNTNAPVQVEQITAKQIFAKRQFLTLHNLPDLIGKKIAVTSPEYHMNNPYVRIFTVKGSVSEWDWMALNTAENYLPYENQQSYVKSRMSADFVEETKRTILLIDSENRKQGFTYQNEWHFYGSDADRCIMYILVD